MDVDRLRVNLAGFRMDVPPEVRETAQAFAKLPVEDAIELLFYSFVMMVMTAKRTDAPSATPSGNA